MEKQQHQKNKRLVWQILKNKGLTDKVIAAMMGNIEVETGGTFDYKTKQRGGGPGQGLFQLQGVKLKAYKHFLQIKKLTNPSYKDSALAQIQFFLNSIDEDPKINLDKNTVGPGNIKKINNKFRTGTVDEITRIMCQLWQRAGISHMDRRLEAAHKNEEKFAKSESTIQTFSMNEFNKDFLETVTEPMNDFLKKMKSRLETGTLDDFLNEMKSKSEKRNETKYRIDNSTYPQVDSNDYDLKGVCDLYNIGGDADGWTKFDNDNDNDNAKVSDDYSYGGGANVWAESDDDDVYNEIDTDGDAYDNQQVSYEYDNNDDADVQVDSYNDNPSVSYQYGDYQSNDYENSDYESNDYENSDYESNDYESNHYENSDYESNDYENSDYERNDYGNNDYGNDDYGNGVDNYDLDFGNDTNVCDEYDSDTNCCDEFEIGF